MLLVNPPVSKACEPPLGIARIAGALEAEGIEYGIFDANLEGIEYLLSREIAPGDTWTKRALKHVKRDTDAIRSWDSYRIPGRYGIAVGNVNRILHAASSPSGQSVSLSDYDHPRLNPVRSPDLRLAFERPEENVFFGLFKKRLDELVNKSHSRLIGFSLSFLNQAICTFAMAGYLKKAAPDSVLVLGGSLVSSWADREPFTGLCSGIFDHVIFGPGEEKIVELCKGNRASCGERYSPSYDKFAFTKYFSPVSILPYNTSTGCYWNKCTFCPENAERNGYFRIRNSAVSDDIESLAERHSAGLIHFTDSAIPPSFLRHYSTRHGSVPWYGFMRVDENLASPDFARSLKDSGCVMLELGVESGNDRVLRAMNKGGSVSLASKVLENLSRAGISTYVYLLFGTPEEDEESARDTLGFVARLSDAIGFLNLAIFNMPVMSGNATTVESKEFYSGDLSLYVDFEHPKGWSRKRVRAFLDAEFRTHASIAPIIGRRPPAFTSNHAPLFVLAGAHAEKTRI